MPSVLQELVSEGNVALANVLRQFAGSADQNNRIIMPNVYSKFFRELCKNSPVLSLYQNDTGLPIFENVVHQKIDICFYCRICFFDEGCMCYW